MNGALGAILVGGESRRMGRDKAAVTLGGRTFVDLVAAALRPVTGSLVAVGRSAAPLPVPRIDDPPGAGRGPLAGLAAALGHSAGGPVILVGVDHPWVRPETLGRLLDRFDGIGAVVPEADGVRQVTCAVYPGEWAGACAAAARRHESIQTFLDRLPHRIVTPPEWEGWGEDGRSWFSVDTPHAVDDGIDRFGTPAQPPM